MNSIKFKHEQTLSVKDGRNLLLRGGGCINTSMIHDIYSIDAKNIQHSGMPTGFPNQLIKYSNLLHEKAIELKQGNSHYEIMTSIQWFIHNQEYFYLMCQNEKLAFNHLDLLTIALDKILKQAPIYIRASGNIGLYILSICNILLRVFYSLFIKKKKFQLKKEYVQNLEIYIDEIQQTLESDLLEVWKTGFEFELQMIKIVIDKLPKDCEQGQEILNQVALEILMSIISLQPSEGLITNIINGGRFLFNKIQNKFAKPIEKYNIYYFFESLKWSLINQLKRHYSVLIIEKQLMDGYNNYIQSSNDWLIHYCWIKMISELITYRPLLQRDIVFSNLNFVEKRENWKNLIDSQQVRPLSYDTNIAKLVFFPKDQRIVQVTNINVDLYNYGINELREFSILLITQQKCSQLKLWNSYLTFTSNQTSQSANQQQESFEFLQFFCLLLQEYEKSKLKLSQAIQSINESLSHLKQDKNANEYLQQLYKNDLIKKSQNLYDIIIQSIYFINEINFQIILSFQRILFLEKQIEKTKQTQSLQLIKQIGDDLKKLYHNNFFNFLIKIPNQFNEFLITLKSFQQSVNEEQQQQLANILIPFTNLTVNELYLGVIDCLTMIEEKMKRFQVEFERIILTDRDLKLSEFISRDIFRNSILEFDNFNFIFIFAEFIQNLLTLNFIDDKWKINLTENIVDNIENYQQILTFITIQQKLIKNLKEQINISQLTYEGVYNSKQDFEEMGNAKEILIILIGEQRNSVFQMINQINYTKNEYQFQQLVKLIANNQRTITSLKIDTQIKTNLIINMTNISAILIEFQYCCDDQQLCSFKEKLEQIYQNLNSEVKKIDKYDQSKLQIQSKINKKMEERLIFLDQYQQLIVNLQYIILQLKDFQISIQQTSQLILNSSQDQKQLLEVSTQSNFQLIKSIRQIFSQIEQLIQNRKQLVLIDSEYLDQVQEIEYQILFYCFNQLCNYTQNKTFQDSLSHENDEIYIEAVRVLQKLQQFSFSKQIDEEENDYKVRECLCYYLITMQNSIQEIVVTQFCQQMIKKLWILEKNYKVKQALQIQELIELQKKLFQSDLSQFTNDLKLELKTKLDILNSLEQKIRFEGDKALRLELQRQLQLSYQEFEEFLDKITEMSQKLDISLELIKENSKLLLQLKEKIEKLQSVVDDIAIDVRKLRGKSVNELLQIRKQVILKQKQIEEMKSIYIELKVDIYSTKTGQKVEQKDPNDIKWLMRRKANDFSGELNKFLWNQQYFDQIIDQFEYQFDDQTEQEISLKNQAFYNQNYKDVMLIKGQAGAGKSTAAQKIEQFLWENQKEFKQSWIPIYISLPTIKNPKFNLLEEVLESENYNFDKVQLREFKELIKQNRINVVLILDSYDEMHFDYIQQNLYQTNRLKEKFQVSEDYPGQHLKIIITTRTEILATSNYQTWFYGEKIDSMIEIELIKFDIDQIDDYLMQNCILNLKTFIFNIYEYAMQFAGNQIELQDFSQIWLLIYPIIEQDSFNSNRDYLLSQTCLEEILKRLQQLELFKHINQQQFLTFEKEMQQFWSASKYQKSISTTNLKQFLETPFLIELIVHVLPKIYMDQEKIQSSFTKNYIQLQIAQMKSQRLIEEYKTKKKVNLDQTKQSEQEFENQAKSILEDLGKQHFFNYYSLINQVEQVDVQTIKMNNQLFTLSNNSEISIVIQAIQQKILTIYDFYNLFIEQYLEQQISKLREYGKIKDYESFKYDLMIYSESLALDMSIHQANSIQHFIKGHLKLKNKFVNMENDYWADQYFDGNDGIQEYKNLLRRTTLIKKKGNSYSFTHKSIQEFFVARFILNLIQKVKVNSNFEELELNIMKLQNLPSENFINSFQWINELNEGFKNLYLNQEQYMGVRNFVVECIKQKGMIENKLLHVIKLTAIHPEHVRAASNCAQILNWCNKNFKFQNLQNIKLEYVNFYGTNFYGSNLRNSKFSHININCCNFIKSNLTNINWHNTVLQEKPILKGHVGNVNQIAFSPDGSDLASCGNDKLVIIWNYKTGKQIRQLEGHQNNVNSVCFAKDNIILLSGSDDYMIILWQFQEGVLHTQLDGHISSVKQIAFSPNGITFASCSEDGSILLWEFSVRQQKSTIQAHSSCINSIAFSIDNQTLASGGHDKSIMLWEYESGNSIMNLQGHLDCVTTIAFAIDGYSLVSGSWDRMIIIWDYKKGSELRKIETSQCCIESINFSQDGLLLASGNTDKSVILWDFKTAKQIGLLEGHSDVVFSVAFSTDGSTLASCGRDSKIILWDYQASKQIERVEGHTQRITAIQFSQDGLIIASASADKTIILWNFETGQILKKLESHSGIVTTLAFSLDGLHLASGSHDKTIILWDIRTGENIGRIGSHINLVTSLTFSSNGWALASAGYDKAIIVWDYKTKRIRSKLEGHSNFVLTVAFSQNGIILASGSQDKTILIWDYMQKKQLGKLEGHLNSVNHIVFSQDGCYLASCSSDCTIILWNYKTYKQVKKIGTLTNQINQIAFSIDGLTLASVSNDRNIILWDYKSGTILQKIDGHIGVVTSIAYSPDGKILASGSYDKTIRLHIAQQQQQFQYKYSYPHACRIEAEEAIINNYSKIFNLKQDMIISLFLQKGAENIKE